MKRKEAFERFWKTWVVTPFERCQYVFDKNEMKQAFEQGFSAGQRSRKPKVRKET